MNLAAAECAELSVARKLVVIARERSRCPITIKRERLAFEARHSISVSSGGAYSSLLRQGRLCAYGTGCG